MTTADEARERHHLKVVLARLVQGAAAPHVVNQLAVAERFVCGQASEAELFDAKQEIWAYLGSLACYAGQTDGATARVVAACLELGPENHTAASLSPYVELLWRAGADRAAVEALLVGGAP